MTPEQKSAYIMAQAVAASIELQSMLVANYERSQQGLSLAYSEEQIYSLIQKYGLGHNDVLVIFAED